MFFSYCIYYYDGYDDEVGIRKTRAVSQDAGVPPASRALGYSIV
jgi:hypothetical protein